MNKYLPIPLVALSVFIYFFFISPIVAEIPDKQTKIAELEETQIRINEFETLRNSLISRYNEIRTEDLERLEIMLPNSIDPTRMALDMNNLALSNGILISGGINVDTPERSENKDGELLSKLRLTLSLTGTYSSISDYLSSISNSLRIADVESLSFNRSEDDSGFYSFSVTYAFYSFDDAKQ